MGIENIGNGDCLGSSKQDLWSLVVIAPEKCCFSLYGETLAAREARYQGELKSEGVEFIREFGPEESRLINKLREQGDDYEAFLNIIDITHRESVSWQALKSKSSTDALLAS